MCRPNPCLHGGSCRVVNHPLGSRNDRWKYHCICSEWYRGHICQSKWTNKKKLVTGSYFIQMNVFSLFPVYHVLSLVPHPCTRQPCLNGGTCVDAFTSKEENEEHPGYEDVALPWTYMHFSCRCPPGFAGSRCESKSTENSMVVLPQIMSTP